MQHITPKTRDTQPIDRLQFLGLLLTQIEHRQSTPGIDYNRQLFRFSLALGSDAG